MKKLVFVTMLLIASAAIWTGCKKENGIITGVVTDAATGEPVDNANVKLKPRGETTLTGSDGTFQFNNLLDGTYSLSVSKNGYVDLDDDYAIEIKNGLGVRRDIQIASLKESFILTVNGIEISTLDFGIDPSLTQLSFSVDNNGTVPLMVDYLNVRASVNWIEPHVYSSHYYNDSLMPNNGYPGTVYIDRSKLRIGENIGSLSVSFGSLTKQLTVKATGIGTPSLTTPTLLEHQSGNQILVQSSITDNGGSDIIDKGFEYTRNGASYNYSQSTEISLGPGENIFQAQVPTYGRTIYVRAYASNGVHTAYSGWMSFE